MPMWIILTLLLQMPVPELAPSVMTHPSLYRELMQMETEDQLYRQPGNTDEIKSSEILKRHLERMKAIVDEYGWPTISMVGVDGSQAAWLIVQHADMDRDFQRLVLDLMLPLLSINEASLESYAYLYDRIHYPQRYGTQGTCHAPGIWQPREIEDEELVDERRSAMGMGALEDYMQTVSTYLCLD